MKPAFYFDHNATTPVWPEVLEAMQPFWSKLYANPSSLHQAGSAVARELRQARRDVASFLGANDETEIIFTSGGTESNNAAFRSALWTQKGKKKLVTTAVEHSSVIKPVRALQEEGIEVIFVPVTSHGDLDLVQFKEAMTENTALVSVMMANNETGVIFPIEKIGKEVKSRGILFHIDAVQGVGKIAFSLKSLDIDFLSISAHKFGGPKGIGVLYVKKDTPFRSFIFGGVQERGRRAGTENVPGMIGLAAACRRLQKNFSEESKKMEQARNHFEEKILKKIPGVQINGGPTNRLPNTSNLAFDKVDSEALLILLDQEGIYASSGSACISGAHEPSHVLKAMGLSKERGKSSIRFSFGPENTLQEIDSAVDILHRFVAHLREIDLKEQHPHSVNQ